MRWPARFQQALLAAARGDSAKARAITEEMIGWAVPRRAGAVHAYALHARALDAIGRADFENAYRDACAISPAGTIASHVPHAMWMVLDLVEAATRTGRKDEATAHVAAAQETGLPAISSRLALITSGAAAMAAADDDDAITLFEQALDVPGADHWPFDLARIQLLFGERLRRARQQLAPGSCSPPHTMPSSGSAPGHGRNELATSCGLPVSRPAGRTSSGQRR